MKQNIANSSVNVLGDEPVILEALSEPTDSYSLSAGNVGVLDPLYADIQYAVNAWSEISVLTVGRKRGAGRFSRS